MNEVVGLLLAAGFSRRYGAPKLVELMSPDTLMAELSCRNLMQGTDRVIAVVRPEQHELAQALMKTGADVRSFEEAHRGMGATLSFAVRSAPSADGWLIALADMPLIKASTIRKITESLRSGSSLVMPAYRGQRGHPVGFNRTHYPALIQLEGDRGARSIIVGHADATTLISVDDAGILQDIDTPDDLIRHKNTIART